MIAVSSGVQRIFLQLSAVGGEMATEMARATMIAMRTYLISHPLHFTSSQTQVVTLVLVRMAVAIAALL